MAIKSIRAQNYLSFEDTGWLDINKINLLYGPNASGKNIIKSMIAFFIHAITNNQSLLSVAQKPLKQKYPDEKTIFVFRMESKSSLSGMLSSLNFSNDPDVNSYIELSLSFTTQKDISILKELNIGVTEENADQAINFQSIFNVKRVEDSDWKFSSTLFPISSSELESDWRKITFEASFPLSLSLSQSTEEIWEYLKRRKEEEREKLKQQGLGDEEIESIFQEEEKEVKGALEEIKYIQKILSILSNDLLRFLQSSVFISPDDFFNSLKVEISNKEKISRDLHTFFGKHIYSQIEFDEMSHESYSGYHVITGIIKNSTKFQPDATILFEHPEVLLDGESQLSLMDYLLNKALEQETKIIIETHSELMLLRLIKRLKQSSRNKQPKELPKLLYKNDISIWVIKSESIESSKIIPIQLSEQGEFITPWPNGFFEEGFNERFS